jgi:hypothetical protein
MSYLPTAQSSMVKEVLEEKLVFNLNVFDNINFMNILINLIKIVIFFELGFSFYFLIYSIIEGYGFYPGNLFRIIYGFFWTGFQVFLNCFIELISNLLALNIDLVIFYLSIFLIGFFIMSIVEINPNISNYLICSFVYGLFIYLHIVYISKYFDFNPEY